MKTIARYQPVFSSADTIQSFDQVPPGKIWMVLVTVEVVELEEKDDQTEFMLLPALPSALDDEKEHDKANLFRMAMKRLFKTLQSNWDHFRYQKH